MDSPVPIRVRVSFNPLECTETTGLFAATSMDLFAAPASHPEFIPNVWYPASLANRLSGAVLDPDLEEIVITFNLDLGQPDCLARMQWYYGLDNRGSASQADMVTTVLHELAHGLGFGPVTRSDSSKVQGRGDVFSQYALDTSTGKTWNEMTDKERAVSALNTRAVVWNGINVRKDVPKVLRPGTPMLRITEPASMAGDYYVATASFGPPLSSAGVTGQAAAALDEANADGPSTTDACSPILNTAEIAGRIALVDRGTCTFVQKARNVQAAGAIGLIVVNNVEGTFPLFLSGTDPAIQIPVVHSILADGNAVKKALAAYQRVTVDLLADPDVRAGADRQGRPILFTSNPPLDRAAMSHWDPSTTPNQLMEPDIQDDLTYSVEPPQDLTLTLLRDLGWFTDFDGVPDGVDQCPGSDRAATLVIQGCDTHITNTTFTTGCRISDYFKPCEGLAPNSAGLASCVGSVSSELVRSGKIPTRESGKIQACVARPPRR